MTDTPAAFSWRMTSNRVATSASSSDEVGSSITTSMDSKEMARAIATICWRATLRVPSGRVTSTRTPRRSSRARASACMRPRSSRPRRRGSRPRKMFSATDRNPTRLISW
jgi:hypothetical protein